MAVLARLTSPQGSGPSWQVTHFCSRILQRDNVREWSLKETFVAGKQAGDVARVLVEECHLPVSPKYSSISICQVLSSYFNTKIQLPSSFAPVPTSPLFNFFAVSFHVAIVVVVPHQFQFSFNLSLYSELVAELDAHLPSLLPTCKSKPGASELVAHLKANRVPLAIATSSRWKIGSFLLIPSLHWFYIFTQTSH